MSIELVDAHCHINFFSDAGDVALKCEEKKVHTIYVTTLPSQFDETYEYVKDLKYIYPSLGFHCLEQNYDLKNEKQLFLKNLDSTRYIGEIGLDFSKKAVKSHKDQLEVFKFILSTIKNKNKIVSVHSNSAEDKVFELLTEYGINIAIFHWYSGKISTLNKIIMNGYYFSINQAMCKSKKGQNIISKLPKNKVLVETDAPFIKDVSPYKNNEVYLYLSNIWQMKLEDVIAQVLDNFKAMHIYKKEKSLFD